MNHLNRPHSNPHVHAYGMPNRLTAPWWLILLAMIPPMFLVVVGLLTAMNVDKFLQ